MTGYSKRSNEYYIFDEIDMTMLLTKSVQRVPADQGWKPQGLQEMNVPCKQLYDRRPARGVQVEGVADGLGARSHDAGRVRAQRA